MNSKDLDGKKLGYWFYPPESEEALGGNRLDIVINETPTMAHFDPERVNLNARTEDAFIEKLKIVHPWYFNHSYQVLPGIVEIIDRKGKKIEAYIFGGTLEIDTEETSTVCTLTSSASIIEMGEVGSLQMMFIEEVEILLAERSASLLAEHRVYEKHLVEADPFQLYLACLQTLIQKYDTLKQVDEVRVHEFSDFLHRERRRLRNSDQLPREMPTLAQVL